MSPPLCPRCGERLEVPPDAFEGDARIVCPECGEESVVRAGEDLTATAEVDAVSTADVASAPTRRAREGFSTMFQPRILLDDRDRALALPEPGETQGLDRPEEGPELPPPRRSAYLLRVGAPRGTERVTVPSALTVLGRAGADVDLGDPSVSVRHFQIEAIGDEFFVRDLDSRNGTYLNGTKIRYAELRPGDQLRAGRTVLVFRTVDDGV
ncbi:MAG: FHA domain-containing protein [Holophagales bacterium]|nr:FHA domain-containing protein [Holophagales bacterium]